MIFRICGSSSFFLLFFFFWRERVAIFIGLDGVENVRETAPSEKRDSHTDKQKPLRRPIIYDPIYSAAAMISKSLKNPYPPYTDQILLTRAVSTDHSPISYLLTSRCYYIKLRVWTSS